MYIPKIYRKEDKAEIVAFMKRFSFGTITSIIDSVPVATHLPFIVEERSNDIYLISHLARANPQSQYLDQQYNLFIFSEPHAYISPKHYDKKVNVPTWNYMSVHAYGKATLITEKEGVFNLMASMINNYEPGYIEQWQALPIDYKDAMIEQIIAFEVKLTKIQYKEKLSQNKKTNERKAIIDTLSKSNDSNEQMIAKFMGKNDN